MNESQLLYKFYSELPEAEKHTYSKRVVNGKPVVQFTKLEQLYDYLYWLCKLSPLDIVELIKKNKILCRKPLVVAVKSLTEKLTRKHLKKIFKNNFAFDNVTLII